jgi:DNA polymerase-3 subunit delta'
MTAEFKTAGHSRIKEQLVRALESGQLGHAYLFSGEGGIGKFSMALEFAMAYLCKSENKPCLKCESCVSIKKYNNPHFQYVFPLKLEANLRKEDDFTQDGWEYINEKTRERIDEPYFLLTDYSAPIYVGRIRNMNDNILNGRGQKTATIIDGIDTLSAISLNTMLKTLEEPPKDALIILLARYSVLPTVRSRCILYKFGAVSNDEVKNWLKDKAPQKSDEEISYLAQISQNNLGNALQNLSQNADLPQKFTSDFAEIVFAEKSDFKRMINLEKFTNNLGRNFDLAQQILVFFLAQIRAAFLYATDFSQIKPEIYLPNFKNFEQATLCCEAIDNSILSIKRSSPLSMAFADLTIKLTEIFNERK